ncbi:MAG: hypothetical protein WCE21_04480 [Candidatus Babeliales bacterium]
MNFKQFLFFVAAMLPVTTLLQVTPVIAGPEKALETGLLYAQKVADYTQIVQASQNAAATVAAGEAPKINQKIISLAFSDAKGFWFGALGFGAATVLVATLTHVYQKYRANIDHTTSTAITQTTQQQAKQSSFIRAQLSDKAQFWGTLATIGLGVAAYQMGQKAMEHTSSMLSLFIRDGYLCGDVWRAWRA